MSTSISISTGALTRSRTYQDDAKAQTVLNLAADHLGATGTPAQRLDAVLDDLVQYLIECARQQHRAAAGIAAAAEAGQIKLE